MIGRLSIGTMASGVGGRVADISYEIHQCRLWAEITI